MTELKPINEFIKTANNLIEYAEKKQLEAQSAIDEVTRYIQSKYPEVTSEYLPSDGGITFIGLQDTEVETQEFYGVENLIKRLGQR